MRIHECLTDQILYRPCYIIENLFISAFPNPPEDCNRQSDVWVIQQFTKPTCKGKMTITGWQNGLELIPYLDSTWALPKQMMKILLSRPTPYTCRSLCQVTREAFHIRWQGLLCYQPEKKANFLRHIAMPNFLPPRFLQGLSMSY